MLVIVIVKENDDGKIELTKEELEELLKKAEDEGRKSSSTLLNWPKTYTTPAQVPIDRDTIK